MQKKTHLEAYKDYLQGLDKFSRGTKTAFYSSVRRYLIHLYANKTNTTIEQLDETYKRKQEELDTYLRQISIEEMTPETVNSYINYVKETKAMSSQVGIFFALRKYLWFLEKNYNSQTYEYYKKIHRDNEGKPKSERQENPLTPKRVEQTTRKPLSDDELNKLYEVSKHNPRDYAILKVIQFTGQRRETIHLMDLANLDRDNRRITVYAKGKDGKPRIYTIPIDIEAINSIDNYLKVREQPGEGYIIDNWGIKRYHKDSIFLNGNGQRLSGIAMHQMLKRYSAKAGIKRSIFLHLFRHTRCDELTRQGFTEKQIMLQTGHLHQQSVQRYINPDLERTQKLFEEASERKRNQSQPTETPKEIPIPEVKPTHPEDKTDRYIALLEKGVIDKDTFRQLMSLPNNTPQSGDSMYR